MIIRDITNYVGRYVITLALSAYPTIVKLNKNPIANRVLK